MSDLSRPGEPFAPVARRLNMQARLVAIQDAAEHGEISEVLGIARDLEEDIVVATSENEKQAA